MLCAVGHRHYCHEHCYYYYLMLYIFGRYIEKEMSISIHAERSQKVVYKMSSLKCSVKHLYGKEVVNLEYEENLIMEYSFDKSNTTRRRTSLIKTFFVLKIS